VKWVTDALDEVRRETWNDARRARTKTHARDLKHARYALWKNPEDLTAIQQAKLAWVAKINCRLYRAYLLKEQFRAIIAVKGRRALVMLEEWLAWTARSPIPAFVELGRRIRNNLPGIQAALYDLSNALIESTDTKLRLLTPIAYGFKEPKHLITLALPDRGGYCPPATRSWELSYRRAPTRRESELRRRKHPPPRPRSKQTGPTPAW
jgi:transposase